MGWIITWRENSLNDPEILINNKEDKLALIRDKAKQNLHKAYERSARIYNKRSRDVQFHPGQQVFKRSFIISSFKNNTNAKFEKKFTKCRVVQPIGNNMYKLETLTGRSLARQRS